MGLGQPRLPREVVDSSLLEILKTQIDMVLLEQGLDQRISRGPSQPNDLV